MRSSDTTIGAHRWYAAVDAFNNGDRIGALFLFKSFAKEGSLSALTEIGNIYELGGGGVSQDFGQAKLWYERAISEAKDTDAYVALARLYYLGCGVNKNAVKAFELYMALENEPHAGAAFMRGHMCEYGEASPVDLENAYLYYARAVELGHVLAMKKLALLKIKRKSIFSGLFMLIKAVFLIFCIGFRNVDDSRLKV